MKNLLLATALAVLLAGCSDKPVETAHGTSSTQETVVSGHIDSLNRTYHLKDLDRVTLKMNGHDIQAWVMDDEGKRREGMMWLTAEDVKDDDGMIFVFPSAEQQGFWMKNTILALDIIFISDKKKVLNVQKGAPEDDKHNLPSAGAAMYVLEMKQGAAERLGIKAGSDVTIPDTVKSK